MRRRIVFFYEIECNEWSFWRVSCVKLPLSWLIGRVLLNEIRFGVSLGNIGYDLVLSTCSTFCPLQPLPRGVGAQLANGVGNGERDGACVGSGNGEGERESEEDELILLGYTRF